VAENIPLHLAVLEGHVKIAKLLLKLGCNRDAKNVVRTAQTLTPYVVTYYVDTNEVPIKRFPIEDASALHAIQFGKTAVHVAAERNKLDCLRLLLEAGGRADVEDAQGCTALDVARAQKHPVRLLTAPCYDPCMMRITICKYMNH
jgi:ankyrin repeat protein